MNFSHCFLRWNETFQGNYLPNVSSNRSFWNIKHKTFPSTMSHTSNWIHNTTNRMKRKYANRPSDKSQNSLTFRKPEEALRKNEYFKWRPLQKILLSHRVCCVEWFCWRRDFLKRYVKWWTGPMCRWNRFENWHRCCKSVSSSNVHELNVQLTFSWCEKWPMI